MWIGVTRRFQRFHADLLLTPDQRSDGFTKQLGVRQSLQRGYHGETTDDPPGFMVGSWGKGTQVRPPNDIDLFVPLPLDVYTRIEGYSGNKQSALLQEVKAHLLVTYPQTATRADGQVVVVAFNSIKIEVVPVFRYNDAGQFYMPDTNGGGSWKIADPLAEMARIEQVDVAANRNVRSVVQMMKVWKRHCNVPLKSYLLEILVCDFMANYQHRDQDYFYYDWFMRDFLNYLVGRRWGSVVTPGTLEMIGLGDDWYSRAVTARDRAVKACEYEREDYTMLAGEEWQKIFGPRIPDYLG